MLKIVFGILFVLLIICAVLSLCSGCRTTPVAGTESLVESGKLISANAERAKWTAGLAEQLREEIGEGIADIDRRAELVEGGLQRTYFLATEYRKLVLDVIDRLQQLENEVQAGVRVDDAADSDTGGVDRD